MASTSLGSCLKRYKLGTERVVEWLCSTARDVARRGTEALDLSAKLTTKDLVRLAEYIAQAKPAIAVPGPILVSIADVIKGRTFCADFFQRLEGGRKRGSQNLLEVNARHRYFINGFTEVQALLRTLDIAKPDRPLKHSRTKTVESNHKNLFELLQLEEPANVSPSTEPSSCRSNPQAPAKEVLPSFEEDYDDACFFAIWCTFEDIREIRLSRARCGNDTIMGT
ncbi:hypothetical protein Slin14017_G090260 [Septoria linicola]|nr:hypothetical protein Slin14017_G090260 [Septoria linicola]